MKSFSISVVAGWFSHAGEIDNGGTLESKNSNSVSQDDFGLVVTHSQSICLVIRNSNLGGELDVLKFYSNNGFLRYLKKMEIFENK